MKERNKITNNKLNNIKILLEQKEAVIDRLNIELSRMKNSKSWIYTSYLRDIARKVNKITSIKISIVESGGFNLIFKKSYHIAKTQGISVFFNKAINYLSDGKNDSSIVGDSEKMKNLSSGDEIENRSIPVVSFDVIKDKYTPFVDNKEIKPTVRAIAFYLPQFHPFTENDNWWGKGFTEWSNVGKALPNYHGHYQPHCPIHLGYYDLRVKKIMEEQAALAKNYGVYGFNYYFYWFGGKILMDLPLEQMLHNKDVDIPFCLTWANENWTRRWDGQENDVLIAQSHSEQDSIAFIQHLIKYFNDGRYIRINDCPVILIYRANIIPKMKETLNLWRNEVKKHGIKDIYAVCCQTFGLKDPGEYGFDAAAEFPPHTIKSSDITNRLRISNPNYKGHIYSYDEVVENATREVEPKFKLFRTAMLSWDNTARKQDQSHTFHGFSLIRYKQWLSTLCNNAFHDKKYSDDEKIVFINAWNEWAEGTHLEPDRKYGYGYLQATYDVVSNYDHAKEFKINMGNINRSSDYAVIIHAHYEDVLIELIERLEKIKSMKFDLFFTSSNATLLRLVRGKFPSAHLHLVENRGRDILPFIDILRIIDGMGYSAVCKLHTKKSVYRNDGDLICERLFSGLIGDVNHVKSILGTFRSDLTVGMIATAASLVNHSDHNMTFDLEVVNFVSRRCGVGFEYSNFPAGSMFWFRPEAFSNLLAFRKQDFPVERGLADGTLAHGIERMFTRIVIAAGFQVIAV